MGTPVYLQWLGPWKDIPHQTPNRVDRPDALQRALLANTPHMYNDVKAHLQGMLDIGAIWKLHSPWASTVVLVQKKDGCLRFCIDFGRLNSQTVKHAYSLPQIDETLKTCRGSSGSPCLTWSLGTGRSRRMKRASHWLHSLWGHWDFSSVIEYLLDWPMPPTFQWLMETCLGDLSLNWCIIYLDDIVIFSKDPTSHIIKLEAMFQKLEQAELKLKPSKCELFHRQITYLGHIVSAQGIATDEGKIDAIKTGPPPPLLPKSNVFLGLWSIITGSSPSSHR